MNNLEQDLIVKVPVRVQLVIGHGALLNLKMNVFCLDLGVELQHEFPYVVFDCLRGF